MLTNLRLMPLRSARPRCEHWLSANHCANIRSGAWRLGSVAGVGARGGPGWGLPPAGGASTRTLILLLVSVIQLLQKPKRFLLRLAHILLLRLGKVGERRHRDAAWR